MPNEEDRPKREPAATMDEAYKQLRFWVDATVENEAAKLNGFQVLFRLLDKLEQAFPVDVRKRYYEKYIETPDPRVEVKPMRID